MSSKQINILLVDDHAIVTDGIKALLSAEHHLHIKGEARSGDAAIEMLSILNIDLVLLDIDMPGMNGIETVKWIKKNKPGIKVLMLTMHDEKAVIRQLKDIGADGYLLKNAPRSELLAAINDVAEGREHFSEEVTAVLLSPDAKPDRPSTLTEREIEIIRLIAEGLSNKEIGEKLFISHRTVDTHRTNVMNKLGLHNVAGIVRFAIEQNLLDD